VRFFNTVGSINPENHYFIPHRLDWEQLEDFIEKEYYFILHAPRQSGKTTAIQEFGDHLNRQGTYKALYVSTEMAHTAVNDIKKSALALLQEIKGKIAQQFPGETATLEMVDTLSHGAISYETLLNQFLTWWTDHSDKPLILFFDEFDGLIGDSLISVLKQLRSGYSTRPKHFPQTVCLIGVRDLRDYKVKTKTQEELGVLYSPFNIKASSERLRDFTQEQVRMLYLQHTEETGQQFTPSAIDHAYHLTQGQPWLVNALAYQACFTDPATTLRSGVPDCSKTITKELIETAKEALIKRRETHLDALVSRLTEERVRNVIDAIINGAVSKPMDDDDIKYVEDLGLIKRDFQNIWIANPIYQEILPYVLSSKYQSAMSGQSVDYYNTDGSLNMRKLLCMFTEFFRENSECWIKADKKNKKDAQYTESGPHLILFAFLQRVVNGVPRYTAQGAALGMSGIQYEYALGSKRVDILVKIGQQRIVIELKIWYGPQALLEGLEQTAQYMDKSDATEGHLVIFDRNAKKTWTQKIYQRQEQIGDKTISVWGM